MDRNFFLAIALSLGVLLLWGAFEQSRRPPPPPTEQTSPLETAPEGKPPAAPIPVERPTQPEARVSPAGKMPEVPLERAAGPAEQRVRIETPLYIAELTSWGAGLVDWELRQYLDKSLPGHPNVVLTTLDEPGDVALATPFASLGHGDLSRAPYTVELSEPRRAVFRLERDGVTVRKTYDFAEDNYTVRFRIEVENRSRAAIAPSFDVVWKTSRRPTPDFVDQALVALYDGTLERSRLDSLGKGSFFGGSGSLEPVPFPANVDWGGAELRYFLMAILPESPRDAAAAFVPLVPGTAGATQVGFRPTDVPPGQSAVREYQAYIGPKVPERLEAVGARLEASINQGWAWVSPLARFFSWLLRLCYAVIPNYGVAIIILTVLVRVVTAPLTARQMRSMKRMGELQPRLKELQEKHKDDRQRQSQEMMKLYREAGVNPLGGCLPLVLQFPVFIGLYYALQSSIDLRQAPFMLWIDDLSSPESLFTIPGINLPLRVLPVVMGLTMIAQQKMTPTTMDPAQARMMMTVMPVMFTVLFYQFPSGLVLYWMVSNVLAIAHQMWVNRQKQAA